MKICVYGAASSLIENSFIEAGKELGRKLVERGHRFGLWWWSKRNDGSCC